MDWQNCSPRAAKPKKQHCWLSSLGAKHCFSSCHSSKPSFTNSYSQKKKKNLHTHHYPITRFMQHVHVKSEAASGMQNNTTLCLCKTNKQKKSPPRHYPACSVIIHILVQSQRFHPTSPLLLRVAHALKYWLDWYDLSNNIYEIESEFFFFFPKHRSQFNSSWSEEIALLWHGFPFHFRQNVTTG